MTYRADLRQLFDQYFNELEGFTLRSERFYGELEVADPRRIKQWLEWAFYSGCRAAMQYDVDLLRKLDREQEAQILEVHAAGALQEVEGE